MNKKHQSSTSVIEQNVMNIIHDKKTKIRPKSYYVFLSIISVVSIILLAITSIYFMSIVSLWLRIQTAAGPAFGAKQNLTILISTFPWWALLIGILSLFAIIIFVNKSGRMYKIRLIYLIPLIILTSIVVGYIFSYSALPALFNNYKQNSSCEVNDTNCKPSAKGYRWNK